MTKKITMNEDELRQKLESAIEAGGVIAAQEAARGPSSDQLLADFKGRMAELRTDRRKNPAKLRAIQAEYMEAGLTWEDVDVAPRGSAVDERPNDMNSAMAYSRRR